MPTRARVTVGAAGQATLRIVSALLGAAVAAVLARALPLGDYGSLVTALTLVTIGTNLADFGTGQITAREMSSAPAEIAGLSGALALFRTATGTVIGALMAVVAVLILPSGAPTIAAIVVSVPLALAGAASLAAVLQARFRAALSGALILAQSVAWLAVVVLLAAARHGLVWYGVGFAVVGVANAGAIALCARRETRIDFSGAFQRARKLWKSALPLGLSGLFVTIYYRGDTVLLYWLRGSRETALYAAAYRFLDVLQVLPATLVALLLPAVVLARRSGRDRRLSEFTLVVVVAMSLPVVVGAIVLSKPLIELVYGAKFSPAVPLLTILIPSFVSISLGYVFTNLLISIGRVRELLVIAAAGAAAAIGLNVLLLPTYGAPAAAAITLGTEVAVMSTLGVIACRRLGLRPPWGRWARCAIATAPMAAVAWSMRAMSPLFVVPVCGLTYAAALIGSGGLRIDEVGRLLQRKPIVTQEPRT
jgi:O-antigen/teichoic acid export membrane protein